MELGIKGKLALVTGAGKGIGRSIAEALAREGARLVLVGRTLDLLEAARDALPQACGVHQVLCLDLMDEEAIEPEMNGLVKRWGAPEIIVHNVGGSLGVSDPLAPYADWCNVWRLNIGIPIQMNNLLAPKMVERGWGRIVHLSTVSTTNLTYTGNPAYTAAKSALNSYVKSLGRALAPDGVVVSAVAPGAVYSEGRYYARMLKEDPAVMEDFFKEHLALGRLGEPDEIGATVAFLCSDKASFAVGSIFTVDGGAM
jgi:3-oxoacyl-[acyl-carrier protein] reductase